MIKCIYSGRWKELFTVYCFKFIHVSIDGMLDIVLHTTYNSLYNAIIIAWEDTHKKFVSSLESIRYSYL